MTEAKDFPLESFMDVIRKGYVSVRISRSLDSYRMPTEYDVAISDYMNEQRAAGRFEQNGKLTRPWTTRIKNFFRRRKES